jgi:hypothetical protein
MRALLAGLACALLLAGAARRAAADEEFYVSVSAGQVVVRAKGHWHINTEYPWKLWVGETKVAPSEFVLTPESASVKAPKGEGRLKGGVCNGDQCRMFEAKVTIP